MKLRSFNILQSVFSFLLFISFIFISSFPLSATDSDPEISGKLTEMQKLVDGGDFRQAVSVGEVCVETAEQKFGKNTIENFRCLYSLSHAYTQAGEFRKAIILLDQGLGILKIPGNKTFAFGFEQYVVLSLAVNYDKAGDYSKAESFYKNSIELIESRFGRGSPDAIVPLSSLGRLYTEMHEYTKADHLLKSCLGNITANSDKYGNETSILQRLADVNVKMGNFSDAESLYKRELDTVEKESGKDSRKTARPLTSLGELYIRIGEFAKADSICNRSLDISGKSLGQGTVETGRSLTCLGDLHQALGDFAKAEQFYQQSMDTIGSNDPEFAFVIHRLAQVHYLTGDYPRALSLYQQSVGIIESTLGKEHPLLVPVLHDLALCYWRLGDTTKALSFLERSRQLTEKALGKDSPDLISPLNSLARIYIYKGEYANAEPLIKRALEITENVYGNNHHELVDKLYTLALMRHLQGRTNEAWDLLVRLNTIDDGLIREVFGITSEKQKIAYLARSRRYINLALRELSHLPSSRHDAITTGFDLWLKRKGLVLESQKQFQDALFHSQDLRVADTFKKLAAVRTDLTNLLFTDPDKDGRQAYQQKIADLETRKERLEGELSSLSLSFSLQARKRKVNLVQIAKSLPRQSVLVDFARIDTAQMDYERIGATDKTEPSSRYLAFVLHAGAGNRVDLVNLGEAIPIEKALADLKEALDGRKTQPGTPQAADEVNKISTNLYRLVFKPLQTAIGKSQEIFLSPDGALNLLPFEILRDEAGHYLIQDHTFNYVAASRDLLDFGRLQGSPGKNLVMGNPDFNLDDQSRDSVVRELKLSRGATAAPFIFSRELRNFRFTSLPGTKREVESIRAIIGDQGSEFFLGKQALEEILASRTAPRILHLATHGFYLSDQPLPSTDTAGSMEITPRPTDNTGEADITRSLYENPLVRSGVALAGANTSIDSDRNTQSEGIVTAEKILNLNLMGTDMVVLSACESGLGDVKSGEGVFGLRRAFSQAGAKSLVMSMWSIPDEETKELMTFFYRNLLAGSMNRVQALRRAELQELETVRGRYGNTNPFFWGAFLFEGEP